MTRAGMVLAVVVACAVGGCGTVSNLSKDRLPYGGISEDVKEGIARWTDWWHPSGGHCISPTMQLMIAASRFAVDLPLSVVGDTLTLPITVDATLNRSPSNSATPTAASSDRIDGQNDKPIAYERLNGGIE